MKIKVTLRDTNDIHDNYSLLFNVRDNALGKHFVELFKLNMIDNPHPIEKTYALHGWCADWDSNYPRNLEYLCKQLNLTIAKVNSGMMPLGYPEIKLDFTVSALRDSRYQVLMNEIHHHFEILIGQVWNVSPWFLKASDDTRFHIRLINNLTHEIESIVDTIRSKIERRDTTLWQPPLFINAGKMGLDNQGEYFQDKIKHELILEEFLCFDQIHQWGQMLLYYAQLGKSHLDAFNDQDEVIDRDNISSHRYITGEFCVIMTNMDETQEDKKAGYQRFIKWCDKHQFDHTDPMLGMNVPVVADLDFQNQTAYQIATELRKRNDVYGLTLLDDDDTIIGYRFFNDTWQDSEQQTSP